MLNPSDQIQQVQNTFLHDSVLQKAMDIIRDIDNIKEVKYSNGCTTFYKSVAKPCPMENSSSTQSKFGYCT